MDTAEWGLFSLTLALAVLPASQIPAVPKPNAGGLSCPLGGDTAHARFSWAEGLWGRPARGRAEVLPVATCTPEICNCFVTFPVSSKHLFWVGILTARGLSGAGPGALSTRPPSCAQPAGTAAAQPPVGASVLCSLTALQAFRGEPAVQGSAAAAAAAAIGLKKQNQNQNKTQKNKTPPQGKGDTEGQSSHSLTVALALRVIIWLVHPPGGLSKVPPWDPFFFSMAYL